MVTREDIVAEALKWNGWGNGDGYPGKKPNPMDVYLGRPYEFSCGDSITYWYKIQGLALPSMQQGLSTGFSYCPDALAYAENHKVQKHIADALAGDIILVNTGNGESAGHTELVTGWDGDNLLTIGGDSAPSNVDGYTGQGGVHRHRWDGAKKGSEVIVSVVDVAQIVKFGVDAVHHKAAKKHHGHRLLMLKSPHMHGRDVHQVQAHLRKHPAGKGLALDGDYGPKTANAVGVFQKHHGLHHDRTVGPLTKKALKIRIWRRA